MPAYLYKCSACKTLTEYVHGMNEIAVDCEICAAKESLLKVPYNVFVVKKTNSNESRKEPGKMVNEIISETKEELKREREMLSQREWKP